MFNGFVCMLLLLCVYIEWVGVGSVFWDFGCGSMQFHVSSIRVRRMYVHSILCARSISVCLPSGASRTKLCVWVCICERMFAHIAVFCTLL